MAERLSGLRSTLPSSSGRRKTRRATKKTNSKARFRQVDVAFLNANVLTLASRRPEAQALAIGQDRILKTGTNRKILSAVGKDAIVWNLHGATVLPGFVDCHTHLVAYGLELFGANLRQTRSISEIQDILVRQARRVGAGRWLLGYGWDQEKLKEQRFPNRFDLDAAVPDRPVCIFRICGHMCVINSEVVRLANITAATTPPIGGVIDRDRETGEPSGLLRENAMNIVTSLIPTRDDREVREAALLAMRKAVSTGLTAVHCIVDDPQDIRVLNTMNRAGELVVRIYLLIPDAWLCSATQMGISTGFGDDMLRIQAVKIFANGSLGARTAALEKPYSDARDTSGVIIHPQDELNMIVQSAARHGLQVAIHAIGDRAVSMALTAIEKANLTVPGSSGLRHRVEHASVLNRDLVVKMKNCKAIASVQPHFIVSDVWVPERVGDKRARLVYPLRSLVESGATLVAGSDCPVEPIDPLRGIYAAVAPLSRGYGEQVDTETAIRMFTKNAAYATYEEKLKGTIEVGKLADLVILDRNPLLVAPEEIRRINVLATMVGGRFVYVSKRFQATRVSSARGRLVQKHV